MLLLPEGCLLKRIFSTDKWDVHGCYKENNLGRVWAWDFGKYSMALDEFLILEISPNNDKFSYLLSQGRKNENYSY